MARQPLPNPVEQLSKLKKFQMKAHGASCFVGSENGEAIAIPAGADCYAVNEDAARNGWAMSVETYNRLTTATAPAEVEPGEAPAKSGKNK